MEYKIGKICDVNGFHYKDGGGSRNYCYVKFGKVEDCETHTQYKIENMCRREIPFGCKEGLTRKVYWNLGQEVLFRLDEYNKQLVIVIGVIDKNHNLIKAVLDLKSEDNYSHYEKQPLEEFFENPDESFLTFYSAG